MTASVCFMFSASAQAPALEVCISANIS